MNRTQQALTTMIGFFEWFTAEKAVAYYTMLNDLPDEITAMAIKELIKTSERTPTVATIRKKAKDLMDVRNGKVPVNYSEKWAEYLKAVKHRSGWGVQPHFKDKAMEIACSVVPADEVGRATNKDLSILRSQFIKAYKEAYDNGEKVEEDKRAAGIPPSQKQAITSQKISLLPFSRNLQ
nr:MAG TPA: replisome organizer protein [Caudoviricetes sp.]